VRVRIGVGSLLAAAILSGLLTACGSSSGSAARSGAQSGSRGGNNWSSPATLSTGQIAAVACLTAAACIADDASGIMSWTTDANSPSPHWTKATTFGAATADVFSCPSATKCFAGDENGEILSTSVPESSLTSWSSVGIDAANPNVLNANTISGLSCPSVSLCVAADWGGNSFTSTSPTGSSWSRAEVHPSDPDGRAYIACPSDDVCVGVNAAGYGSMDPGNANSWTGVTTSNLAPEGFTDVSCPSAQLCLATISDGAPSGGPTVFVGDPSVLRSWHVETIGHGFVGITGGLASISCPSSRLCVAVGGSSASGVAYTTSDPSGPGDRWVASKLPFYGPTAVSCSVALTCVVAGGGDVTTASFSRA
jgi:hypothetical protein